MKRLYVFLFAGLLSTCLFAQDNVGSDKGNDPKIKLSGFGYYMFGQAVSGILGDEWVTGSFDHLWVNTALIHLNAESNVTSWLTTKIGFECSSTFPFAGANAMDKSSYFRNSKAYLAQAEGIMHWNFENPIISSLNIRSGLFPYTFNPEVKTLGNYLFRSTLHPVSVQNKVDYPWADLFGGTGEVGLLEDKFKVGALIASEMTYPPFYDFTPSFSLTVNPIKLVDFSASIAFHHAIKANSVMADSLDKKFRGTKGDFRLTLDMKQLFGGMPAFGEEQFKIYSELAILGKDQLEVDTSNLENLKTSDKDTAEFKGFTFPGNSIVHRVPLMLGISLPTWKIFDCLALELEWFYSPYANDWFGLYDKPYARQPTSLAQYDNYVNKDNFKWSLYMKKAVGKFEVRGIFGSDHTIYALNNQTYGNYEQTLKRPHDWHWYIQLRYNL